MYNMTVMATCKLIQLIILINTQLNFSEYDKGVKLRRIISFQQFILTLVLLVLCCNQINFSSLFHNVLFASS